MVAQKRGTREPLTLTMPDAVGGIDGEMRLTGMITRNQTQLRVFHPEEKRQQLKPLLIEDIHNGVTGGSGLKSNTSQMTAPFHNISYATVRYRVSKSL